MEGYVLKINFYTDGDFSCKNKFMKYNEDYEEYNLYKVYNYEDKDVIDKVVKIVSEIRDSIYGKKYVIDNVSQMLDNAIEIIKIYGECDECINGNQEGTEISFRHGEIESLFNGMNGIINLPDGKAYVKNLRLDGDEIQADFLTIINCDTCKNNPKFNNGFMKPHTCDICNSLDEEDCSMWEINKLD